MMDAQAVPGPEVVAEARKRLEGVVRCTPVLTCPALSEQAGCELFLKCENLQHAGAFKFRGASHAVAVLSDKEASRGVVTHSSG
ncbi:MAG: pyridoxal-phosphate dependent enzyme, partial [Planctomycetota bacterium]